MQHRPTKLADNDELIKQVNEQARTIANLKEAMQEIATSNSHLDDERMEETHGRVAMLMRRMAREVLK